MLKPKLLQQEQGFTLGEVLIAILIASLFVAASMQAMVVATVFKVRAQEYSEATTWIQQDLEDVKNQASQYNAGANHNARCVATTPETGYADGLSDRLSGRSETLIKDSGAGTDTANLTKRFHAGKGKEFRLTRNITPLDTPPYAVLKVNYDVSPTPGGSSIATVYTEVIPDAAFQCP